MNPSPPSNLGRRSCGRTLGAVFLLMLLLAPASGFAEDPPDRLVYGFTSTLGYGRASGPASDFLNDAWSENFNLFLEKGRFRGGIGIEFHRFRTLEPVAFDEVSAVPFYLHGTFSPWPRGRVRPYLQARLGLGRLHDQVTLDRAAPGVSGWSYGLAPGLEIDISRSLALDLSLSYLSQQTDALPLGNGAKLESLNALTGRAGLTWRAFGRGAAARRDTPVRCCRGASAAAPASRSAGCWSTSASLPPRTSTFTTPTTSR
jgi:hypothetical protein